MRTKTTTKEKKCIYIEREDVLEIERITKKLNERSWNYVVSKLIKLGLEVVKENGGTLK